MFDFRPIVLVIGILLATLGCTMMLPAIVELMLFGSEWLVFFASSVFTLFVGISMALMSWGHTSDLSIKQAFVLTTMAWVALVAFAALPLALGSLDLSYTDAFFEAMSGLTTTGSTVISGLDHAPPGLLLWRALLQWLGGIGIIIMAIAVLPMLQVGGLQLFRVEAFDTSEKILPRATQISGSLSLIYVALTVVCVIGYYVAGMRLFDAVAHALTTIATGGFSPYDASLGHFDNPLIEMVSIVFMILGSIPFLLYIKFAFSDRVALFRDRQVQVFLGCLAAFIVLIWSYQFFTLDENPATALRHATFNVVSIMTGTGYVSTDYTVWGPFAVAFFFFLMFIGGCAGSTSCGIKIFRFQVMVANIRSYLARIVYPNGVFVPRYEGRALADNVSAAVMSYFFLFMLCFALTAFALNLIGLDDTTALSAAASAIANVGPGLGPIVGPAGNFAALPDSAKWVLSFAMLLGRLELFTVLVMLSPGFWRS